MFCNFNLSVISSFEIIFRFNLLISFLSSLFEASFTLSWDFIDFKDFIDFLDIFEWVDLRLFLDFSAEDSNPLKFLQDLDFENRVVRMRL